LRRQSAKAVRLVFLDEELFDFEVFLAAAMSFIPNVTRKGRVVPTGLGS
jgi:hypothetical protein